MHLIIDKVVDKELGHKMALPYENAEALSLISLLVPDWAQDAAYTIEAGRGGNSGEHISQRDWSERKIGILSQIGEESMPCLVACVHIASRPLLPKFVAHAFSSIQALNERIAVQLRVNAEIQDREVEYTNRKKELVKNCIWICCCIQ